MKKKWLVTNFNNKYFLVVGNKIFRCQVGEGGIEKAVIKTEGDKTTPIGNWSLNKVYYRPDRVLRPKFKKKDILKTIKITENCGWCDDIRSNKYNKYIKIRNLKSLNTNYENLWREDEAYDIIIVISHNIKPTIKDNLPDSIESLPKSGPTVLSSTIFFGVGKAPDLNNKAKSVTS